MSPARFCCLPDSWRTSGEKSTRRCLSVPTEGTALRRIKLAAQRAFMPGEQRQTSIASVTRFFVTQNPLGNIAQLRHRSVQLFLPGLSDVNEDRPSIISI